MPMNTSTRWTVARGLAAAGLIAAMLGVSPLSAAETFTATASVKGAKASGSAPVTFSIDRFVSDADRDRIMAVVKTNDNAAIRKALAAMPDIGYVELASRKTPIKYAYAKPTGSGRLITLVTADPIHFVGGAAQDAKPKAGFDLGLALLILDASDKGDGEITPAARIKMDEAGAIVTSDYGGETVRLTGIAKSR